MNTKYLYIGKRGFCFFCPLFAVNLTSKELSLHLFSPIRTYRLRF